MFFFPLKKVPCVLTQEQQDRLQAEKQRQAELVRLRREKRQADMEGRFDSAALVLGLAERNRQNLEERYEPVLLWERLPSVKITVDDTCLVDLGTIVLLYTKNARFPQFNC